jgi:hypothetical protein
MGVRTWMRIGSLCWIGYLVLAITEFALLPQPMPGTSAAPSVLTAYFVAHGSTIRAYAALDDLANLFLLVFWVYLASRMAGSDPRSRLFSWLALGSGTAMVILEYAIVAVQVTLVDTAAQSVPGSAVLGPLFGNLVAAGLFVLGLFLAGIGGASLASGLTPNWFGWASLSVAALEMAIGVLLTLGVAQAGVVSFAAIIVWIAVAGIVAARLEWRTSPAGTRVGDAPAPSVAT